MTSKEFFRRCEFFAVFEKAAEIFYCSSGLEFIFKFNCYGNTHSSESYGVNLNFLHDFLAFFPFDFDLVYVERYSRSQFNSQFRYFLSFLSRLSDRQMDILSSSGRFEYLLKFRDKFNTMKNTAVKDA